MKPKPTTRAQLIVAAFQRGRQANLRGRSWSDCAYRDRERCEAFIRGWRWEQERKRK